MTIAGAFLAACAEELAAPKPGNVHVYAAGHGMTVADFTRSAEAAAPVLCAHAVPLGRRIHDAMVVTLEAVGQNTNLGILLLCGPLAMAAEHGGASLQQNVSGVIGASDLVDAEAVFSAIRLARPGGLGVVGRHDVHAPATVPLTAAMAEASGRDSVARQWSNGFADVFGDGLSVYAAARARWRDPAWASLAVYLHFATTFADSHVQRRHGAAVALEVRARAHRMGGALSACDEPRRMLPDLLTWDATLKAGGINPGTSADLAVATGFAWRLQNGAAAEWLALAR